MSAELSEPLPGWESVRNSLGEVRAIHGEFKQFFSDVFEQLGSLSKELAGWKDRWQSERQRAEDALQRRATQLEEQRAAVSAEREQIEQAARTHGDENTATTAENDEKIKQLLEVAEQERTELRGTQEAVRDQVARLATIAAELAETRSALAEGAGFGAGGDDQLHQMLEEARQQREQLGDIQEAARAQAERLAAVLAELAEARGELAETRNEITRHREQLENGRPEAAPSQPAEEVLEQVRQMEQRQAELEQERKILESELETVRNRAAEMAELLADQKRQATQQQSRWSDELKRMRLLLEGMSGRLAQAEPPRNVSQPAPNMPVVATPAKGAGAADDDPVLDSVMAQFEMLQRDLAKRRAAKSEAIRN